MHQKNGKELQLISTQEHWKEKGVALVIAHPDDESLFWSVIEIWRQADIPAFVILMTLGQKGNLAGVKQQDLTEERVTAERQKEFISAMSVLGMSYVILPFVDYELRYTSAEEMDKAVLRILRAHSFAALFSFSPDIFLEDFDHVDHNVTGQVAEVAAGGVNISRLMPDLQPVPEKRPELWLLTDDQHRATHTAPLTPEQEKARLDYLHSFYPSQFPAEDEPQHAGIFAKLPHYYAKVR